MCCGLVQSEHSPIRLLTRFLLLTWLLMLAVAPGDPAEPMVEEMKKQVEYFQEQLDKAADAMDNAIQVTI